MNALISIILVSWNRSADLRVALDSIARQDYRPLEIVVVDNGSTDGTLEMLRAWRGEAGPDDERPPLTLYRAPRNEGASVGRNIGLRLAQGPSIAFMDSDAEWLQPDGLRRLAEALDADPGLGAIAPAADCHSQRSLPTHRIRPVPAATT